MISSLKEEVLGTDSSPKADDLPQGSSKLAVMRKQQRVGT